MSVTSYKKLREDGQSAQRWNRLHPEQDPRVPWITEQLDTTDGPIVAVTDYMHLVPDQILRYVPRSFTTLGTDGFGRSDTRAALRRFFETDAAHVVVAVLSALAESGDLDPDVAIKAADEHGIDREVGDPLRR